MDHYTRRQKSDMSAFASCHTRLFSSISMMLMLQLANGCGVPQPEPDHANAEFREAWDEILSSDAPDLGGAKTWSEILELTTAPEEISQKPRLWAPYPAGTSYQCSQGPFGSTSHYFSNTKYGLDFATPKFGSPRPIVAALAGKVGYVEKDCTVGNESCGEGFGNHVKLAHGGNYYTIYAHLSSVSVAEGDKLGRGQLIGYEGTTGDSSGDHLHFGLHLGDASLPSVAASVNYTVQNRDVTTNGIYVDRTATAHICGLRGGHSYESDNLCSTVHDSLGTAKQITNNTTYLGEWCAFGDIDYFKFGGKAGAFTSTFSSTSESIADCSCAILDAQGVELKLGGPEGYIRNDHYNGTEGCACSVANASTATYYLKVYSQMPGAYLFNKTLP